MDSSNVIMVRLYQVELEEQRAFSLTLKSEKVLVGGIALVKSPISTNVTVASNGTIRETSLEDASKLDGEEFPIVKGRSSVDGLPADEGDQSFAIDGTIVEEWLIDEREHYLNTTFVLYPATCQVGRFYTLKYGNASYYLP